MSVLVAIVNLFGISPFHAICILRCVATLFAGFVRIMTYIVFVWTIFIQLSQHILFSRFLSISRKSHGFVLYVCSAFIIFRSDDNSVLLSSWLSSHLQEQSSLVRLGDFICTSSDRMPQPHFLFQSKASLVVFCLGSLYLLCLDTQRCHRICSCWRQFRQEQAPWSKFFEDGSLHHSTDFFYCCCCTLLTIRIKLTNTENLCPSCLIRLPLISSMLLKW